MYMHTTVNRDSEGCDFINDSLKTDIFLAVSESYKVYILHVYFVVRGSKVEVYRINCGFMPGLISSTGAREMTSSSC